MQSKGVNSGRHDNDDNKKSVAFIDLVDAQYRGQIRAVLHDNLVRLETTFLASMIDANPTASTRLSV